MAAPAFDVPLVAVHAADTVAVAVAPKATVRTSPPLRSVTVSVPELTVNVSFPEPPGRVWGRRWVEDDQPSLHDVCV